jgi:hypothetical protein
MAKLAKILMTVIQQPLHSSAMGTATRVSGASGRSLTLCSKRSCNTTPRSTVRRKPQPAGVEHLICEGVELHETIVLGHAARQQTHQSARGLHSSDRL